VPPAAAVPTAVSATASSAGGSAGVKVSDGVGIA